MKTKQQSILDTLEVLTDTVDDAYTVHTPNFAKLAIYLWETKIPSEKFNMTWIIENSTKNLSFDDPTKMKKEYSLCGTSACALGHAPLAGIKARKDMGWAQYSKCMFTHEESDIWCHCFDANWEGSPKDAAKRIAYMLLTGRVCAQNEKTMKLFSAGLKQWRPNWKRIKEEIKAPKPWTLYWEVCEGWNIRMKKSILEIPQVPLPASRSVGTRSSQQG